MVSPTDIIDETVVADLRTNGPSFIKDMVCRILGLPPSAAKGVWRTHAKQSERVYSLLRSLVARGVVATEVFGTRRSRYQRRGRYYLPDDLVAGVEARPPEPPIPATNVVVSNGPFFATRHDGVVFRYAPVSGDPNGEWSWQRLPDLPQD